MVSVAENAHDKDGLPVRDPAADVRGTVPEWPKDDYVAANKAFWRLCLAKAKNMDPKETWEEERFGVKGIVAELKKRSIMLEIWPMLSVADMNAFMTSQLKYLHGNVETLIVGRGSVPGMLWIAYEWRYDEAVALAAYNAKYRTPKAGKNQKDTIDIQKSQVIESAIVVLSESDRIRAMEDKFVKDIEDAAEYNEKIFRKDSEPALTVAERLREAADVYEAVAGREKALEEARTTLLTYLSDMRTVVEGL